MLRPSLAPAGTVITAPAERRRARLRSRFPARVARARKATVWPAFTPAEPRKSVLRFLVIFARQKPSPVALHTTLIPWRSAARIRWRPLIAALAVGPAAMPVAAPVVPPVEVAAP